MTSAIAVRTHQLSKKYRLFASKRHRLLEALHPWRRAYHREFWALRDVTMEIPRGTTVGILGLNGSGKSTLLQLISSVLQPTAGTVHVEGRVAALLELGAGFNPELTGRENVVLNGTIMGLANDEIAARMESIEQFADIGEFFDQPVRTYSSGMFMRVAFATAIHVDPDVLIIDEALSVGDAKFQEKCYRRFRDFQEAGKTILFVTHDRSVVPRMCNHAILLHKGELIATGEPGRIVDLYAELLTFGQLRSTHARPDARLAALPAGAGSPGQPAPSVAEPPPPPPQHRPPAPSVTIDACAANPLYNRYEHRSGNGRAEIIDFTIRDGQSSNPRTIRTGTRLDIEMRVRFDADITTPNLGLVFNNHEGVVIYGINTAMLKHHVPPARAGDVRIYCFSICVMMSAGDWFLDFCVAESASDLCDYRCALAHLFVIDDMDHVGLARFETTFAELKEPLAPPTREPRTLDGASRTDDTKLS
jgi:lipopolysaccharide transport system ATP-binding protein